MTQSQPELTPDERQARHDNRLIRVDSLIAELPEPARKLVRIWRPIIEREGRCGRHACGLDALLEFVLDVRAAFALYDQDIKDARFADVPKKVAGTKTEGSGV